jgi:catechol 2,3-dioxygenase-like lactoylglutathione lyase family enzyme
MIETNGVAHVILSVSEWDQCRTFYQALLPFLGLEQVFAGEDFVYYVGGRTAVGINRCDAMYAGRRFVQGSVGPASRVLPVPQQGGRRSRLCVSQDPERHHRPSAAGRRVGD